MTSNIKATSPTKGLSMAYSTRIDERYISLTSYTAGSLDVRDSFYDSSSVFGQLVQGTLAHGELTYNNGALGLFKDVDIYDLGILSTGYYSIDVDDFTWDFSNFDSGSVSSFSLLNSFGQTLDTEYGTFSNIDFSVTSQSQYYVMISGPVSLDAQYTVTYDRTGDLVTNNPAIFGQATYYGTTEVGNSIAASTSYFDADGNSDNSVGIGWYIDGVFQELTDSSGSFTLLPEHEGKVLSFRFSFYDDVGNFEISNFYVAGTVTNPNDDPTGTVTITGTVSQGETVTANVSALADADGLGTLSYQWKADGTDISGATSSTYTLTQDEVGKAVTVAVSYTDGGGTSESVLSTTTAAVENVNDAPTGSVTIFGTAAEDQTLTLTSTVADADGIDADTVSYQWHRDGSAISGATSSTYVLTQDDVGAVITAKQSYTDDFGNAHSVTSAETSAIDYGPNVVSEGSFDLRLHNNSYNLTLSGSGDYYGYGNDNNNSIIGNSGANTIKTYGGNDKVYGGAGNDKIDLGSGNDYVKAGGGVESFIGGSGTDYISYYDSTGGVTVNLATNKMSGSWAGNDTISGFESISGSKTGGDTITGTSGANTIKTYGGNDKVYGGKGNDKIDLGSGNDYVKAGGGVESFIGGSGTDYISYYDSTGGVTVNLATNKMSGSWAGNDTISGFESISGSKTGGDTITGTSGANTIKTYGGNDKVYGGKGNDKIDLGSGNDYVKAGGGVESFIGGSGTDYISYYDSTGGVTVNLATNKMSGSWAGNDTISGFESISGSKTGGDTITGTSGANTIKTYGGNDKVYGGKGNDKIDLGSGNDYVKAGGGVESFIGGSGTDYISYYDSTGGVTVNLATNKMSGSWAGNDTISGFESISGSKTGGDTITGTSGANTIKTYGGNDKVYGGKGNDKIDLGSGNDYVKAGGGVESFIGGSGTDYISYYASTGGVTVNLATNKMSGSWAGNDTISGFESISGSKTGADTITGTSGANTIKTYGGNDKVYGGKGNDKIEGGSGKDTIEGGAGRDYMYAGNDSDRDVFIFRDIDETATGSQRDHIYQFDSGEDDIDLSFIDANEVSAGDQSFKFSSNGAAANSVWAQDSGSNVLVRGDVNGDTIHDFEIYVASVDDLYVYDFIL